MTDTAIEQRDDAIAEALVAGRSVRAVQRQFSLSQAELNAALERLWPLDSQARLARIRADVGKLDALMRPFFERAIKQADVPSGLLCIKALERLHGLLGLDAAVKVDLQIAQEPPEAPQGHERLFEMIMRISRQGREGNGTDSTVDTLSDSGEEEIND